VLVRQNLGTLTALRLSEGSDFFLILNKQVLLCIGAEKKVVRYFIVGPQDSKKSFHYSVPLPNL